MRILLKFRRYFKNFVEFSKILGVSPGILENSEFLLHKIYGAQIGAFVNNAVEVGEEDGKPLPPPCTKFRVFFLFQPHS